MPYLAEEIHQAGENQEFSCFTSGWRISDEEWRDEKAYADLSSLLQVRKVVLELLEKARSEKKIRSSLEADIVIILPDNTQETPLAELLYSQVELLSKLFIVSEVTIENDQAPIFDRDWAYCELLSLPGTEEYMRLCIKPARLLKCPRCWSYTREETDRVCVRCESALNSA